MLRTIPFTGGGAEAFVLLRRAESSPTVIGPVTSFMIKFEKLMFSKRERLLPDILIAPPKVS